MSSLANWKELHAILYLSWCPVSCPVYSCVDIVSQVTMCCGVSAWSDNSNNYADHSQWHSARRWWIYIRVYYVTDIWCQCRSTIDRQRNEGGTFLRQKWLSKWDIKYWNHLNVNQSEDDDFVFVLFLVWNVGLLVKICNQDVLLLTATSNMSYM